MPYSGMYYGESSCGLQETHTDTLVPKDSCSYCTALFSFPGWFNGNYLGILNDGLKTWEWGKSEPLTSLHKIELLFTFKVLTERKRRGERMPSFGDEHPLEGQFVTFHLRTPRRGVKDL